MKIFKSIINCLSIVGLLLSFPIVATAASPSFVGVDSTTNIAIYSDGSITYHKDNYSGNLTIPSKIKNVAVKSIRDDGFASLTGLTGVTLPTTITTIGQDAFSNCTSLRTINFNGTTSLTSIKSGAFKKCCALTSVSLPSSISSLGNKVFYDCTSLSSLTTSSTVLKTIGSDFIGNSLIRNIDFSQAALTTVSSSAFRKLTDLTSVKLKGSNITIGTYAFENCPKLTEVTVNGNISVIGEKAFYMDGNLEKVTSTTSTITSIQPYTFSGCTKLKTYPAITSVLNIGNEAFSNSGINSINLNGSVATIGTKAFYNCLNIKYIVLGDSVTTIGQSAFQLCPVDNIVIGKNIRTFGSNWFTPKANKATKIHYYPSSTSETTAKSLTNCTLYKLTKLSNVTNLKAVSTEPTSIKLSWTAAANAYRYDIYRSVGDNKNYTLLKSTTSTSYTDSSLTTGKGYYYKVISCSYMSAFNSAGATVSKTAVPATVTISSISSPSAKKITVKWGKQTGSGYQIQYSKSKTFASGNKTVTVSGQSTVSKSFTVDKAKTTYYVRVRAYKTVSGKNYYGAYSAIKSVKTK